MITTYTNDRETAAAFVERINSGEITRVNGRAVWARYGQAPATLRGNGTIEVLTGGRENGFTQSRVWVKIGMTVEIVGR